METKDCKTSNGKINDDKIMRCSVSFRKAPIINE